MKRFFLFALILGGCGGTVAPDPKTFDLGLNPPSAPLPAVRVGLVRAVAPFDGPDMHYRLAFRNAAEIAAFANSRWAASPAEMLRKQMLRGAGDGGRCVLEVEIQEFSQVFSEAGASDARIELRAWAKSDAGRLASSGWVVTEPNAGPDAASGAAAFARAADKAIAGIGRWLAAQAGCR